MAGSPDLFVVCKNCGSEVSPYITECPYCGKRLQKRAPKIERDASGESRPQPKRGRAPKPPKPPKQPKRQRSGSRRTPRFGADEDARPWVTIGLVVLGTIGFLTLAFVGRGDIALVGPVGEQVWRIFTTPFVNVNTWAQLATLLVVAIFGTLLERRHGPFVVLLLWLLGASGGAAVAAGVETFPVALGANAGALTLLLAWAVPVLLARRARPDEDDDADMLGVLVLGVLVAALPIADPLHSEVAGAVGALVGVLGGLVLARTKPR